MSSDDHMRPPLRFPVGTKVMCRTGERDWSNGKVVKHWYRQPEWPPCQIAPYQIELDNERKTLIFAPADDDDVIKVPPPPGFFHFHQGFINDDFSKQCEPIQGRPFLYTGVVPEVGHRTETQVTTPAWSRISGVVTHVGELPTYDMWVTTSGLSPGPAPCDNCSPADPYASCRPENLMVFSNDCPDPACLHCQIRKGRTKMSVAEVHDGALEVLGSLQGQEVTVYGYLNFDFFGRQKSLPFKRGRTYRLRLKFDDRKMNCWIVSSIEDVSSLPAADLPQIFRDWKQGQSAADAPPFDLSETKRQEWFDRVQAENEEAGDYDDY